MRLMVVSQVVTWPEVATAIASTVSAAIFVVAAIFAWKQVGEARRLGEAQIRPFVSLDLEINDFPLIILRIENLGRLIARSVRFEFEPQLETSGRFEVDLREAPLFKSGIPSLPPGNQIPVRSTVVELDCRECRTGWAVELPAGVPWSC
jgi:hypothetical protein